MITVEGYIMADLSTSPSRSLVGFHFVRIALGILLLAAAWLKGVAFWNGYSTGPLLSSPRWQIATIEAEILLGLWLLGGLYAHGSWVAAILLFTALSGFTLYLALDGQQLTNNTARPIYVFGGTTAGYCNATVDLPLTIPEGESRSIRVHVMLRGEVGRFQHPFVLYTNDQRQPMVTASFSGRVISGR